MLWYDYIEMILAYLTKAIGVFSGSSTMLIGRGTSDVSGGQEIDLQAGDVIVLPAGTAHCNVQSTPDYKYIGVYPKVSALCRGRRNAENSCCARRELLIGEMRLGRRPLTTGSS